MSNRLYCILILTSNDVYVSSIKLKLKLNLLGQISKVLPLAKNVHDNTCMKHINYNIT